MLSPNFYKFLALFALTLLSSTGCNFWQSATGNATNQTPFATEEFKSEIPFTAKEPEIFQAEIVVTANNQENKTFVARNNNNRRYDYNFGAKNQLSVLQTDKNYLILPEKKVYAENTSQESDGVSENWTDFLTTEWLNSKPGVKFFKLDSESNLTKYRVSFGEAENAKSESLITVDEAKNLIVRQEFYSTDGEQKTLMTTVELKNLKFEAEADLFAVPKDFRKVSLEEFREILQSQKNDE